MSWLLSLSAHPSLRSSEDRKPNISPHHELPSAVFQPHPRTVCLPVFRIQNFAAAPLVSVRPHVAQDFHPENSLPLAFTRTLVAYAVLRVGGDEQRLHDADELAIGLPNLDDRCRLPVDVADCLPQACWAGLGSGGMSCRDCQRRRPAHST